MADYPRRPAARLAAAVAIAVCLSAAPVLPTVAAAESPSTVVDRWAADADDRFLYWAQRAGAPKELIDALQLSVPGDRFIINLPWDDMTGDRGADVLAAEFDFGPGGIGLTGVTTWFEALDGRNGRSLWRREIEGSFVFPIEISLGRAGRTGVLVV